MIFVNTLMHRVVIFPRSSSKQPLDLTHLKFENRLKTARRAHCGKSMISSNWSQLFFSDLKFTVRFASELCKKSKVHSTVQSKCHPADKIHILHSVHDAVPNAVPIRNAKLQCQTFQPRSTQCQTAMRPNRQCDAI